MSEREKDYRVRGGVEKPDTLNDQILGTAARADGENISRAIIESLSHAI